MKHSVFCFVMQLRYIYTSFCNRNCLVIVLYVVFFFALSLAIKLFKTNNCIVNNNNNCNSYSIIHHIFIFLKYLYLYHFVFIIYELCSEHKLHDKLINWFHQCGPFKWSILLPIWYFQGHVKITRFICASVHV